MFGADGMRALSRAARWPPVAIAAVCSPARALADDEPDRQAARDEYRDGFALQQQGNCAEALGHYRRSYKLHRAPTTALHTAQCERALGRLDAAAAVYRATADLPLDTSASEEFRRAKEQAAAELAEMEATREYRRTFGVGLSSGAGAAAGTVRTGTSASDTSATFELLLPTVEVSWFLPGEHAITIRVPITNDFAGSAIVKGFVGSMDVVLTFNVGRGDWRLVAGPGVGFTVLVGGDLPARTAGGLRLPAEVGVEYLWSKHSWGLKLGVRPWIEISSERDVLLGDASTTNTTGGGIVGALTLTSFATR